MVTLAAPRVAPLPPDRWDRAVQEAMRATVPVETLESYLSTSDDSLQAPNAFTTIVHNPPLAATFFAFNRMLLREGSLPARYREIVVLRVAWRTGSNYEWAQHVRLATRIGMTPEDIAAIPAGAADNSWTAFERSMLTATDQMVDSYQVSDEIWSRLAEELDESQLVELVFVVGAFVCVAMALNSLGVQLDPDIRDITFPALTTTPGTHATSTVPQKEGLT